jgi:hypothetical protein
MFLAVNMFSCVKYSDPKQEFGEVIEKQFEPEINGTGTGTTFNSSGSVGLSYVSIHEDEKFLLIFKCQHKTVFTTINKNLYYSLNKGDKVIIHYWEKSNGDFEFYTALKYN